MTNEIKNESTLDESTSNELTLDELQLEWIKYKNIEKDANCKRLEVEEKILKKVDKNTKLEKVKISYSTDVIWDNEKLGELLTKNKKFEELKLFKIKTVTKYEADKSLFIQNKQLNPLLDKELQIELSKALTLKEKKPSFTLKETKE